MISILSLIQITHLRYLENGTSWCYQPGVMVWCFVIQILNGAMGCGTIGVFVVPNGALIFSILLDILGSVATRKFYKRMPIRPQISCT